jgi:hypothetical protein
VNDLACVGIIDAYSRHHIGLHCARHESVVVSERSNRRRDIATVAGEIHAGRADTNGSESVVNIG